MCSNNSSWYGDKMMTTSQRQGRAKGTFVVINIRGIHTRPATEIVKTAARYKSTVMLYHRNSEANAKSLLSILMLAAEKGTKVRIEAEGEDAEEVVSALLELAKNQFNMSY